MIRTRSRLSRSIRVLSLALSAMLVGDASASTRYIVHQAESDWRQGVAEQVVISSLGELRLSRAVTMLPMPDPKTIAVFSLVEAPDGTIYAGTGAGGKLFRRDDDQLVEVADFGPAQQVSALAIDARGRVLIGLSGPEGGLMRLEDDKPVRVFTSPDVLYVWAIHVDPDGAIWLATGPNGQLIGLDAQGDNPRLVHDSDQANLLSLAADEQAVFVGTDPDGLVLRIERRNGHASVLFDSPRSEIGGLVSDGRGGVYAITSQAVEGDSDAEPQSTPAGRADDATLVPLPGPERAPPAPDPAPIPGGLPRPEPMNDAGARLDPLRLDPPARPTQFVALQDDDAPMPIEPDPDPDAPAEAPGNAAGPGLAPPTARRAAPMDAPADGNSVYHISAEGVSRELWSGDAVLLSMARLNDALLIGTGNRGRLLQLSLAGQELYEAAQIDALQIPAILPTRDGRVLLGLANAAGVAALSAGYATVGTYESPVLDATQPARFGNLRLRGNLPEGTSMLVQSRTSQVADPLAAGWSEWSAPAPAEEFVRIDRPGGRFLQYRIILQSEGKATPALSQVAVSYRLPNLPPALNAVIVSAGVAGEGGGGENPAIRTIAWEATDANDDDLHADIHYRATGSATWVKLADKLTEDTFEWDTRGLPDGLYQLRVTVSDAPSNPADDAATAMRLSEPVLIDNTPPAINDVRIERKGERVVVRVRVSDRTGTVAEAAWSEASGRDWNKLRPVDTIADSPEEQFEIELPLPADGPGAIVVRARDGAGNEAYRVIELPGAD
ncbi:MAG TPA: hypothetical protein PKB10_01905 [Tepidisphaeraceae bacterium]|nr:hypothetical protein [Tepidisphaeraceae bacterium]